MSGLADFLITDRTIADVNRVKYLSSLWGPAPGQWRGTRDELVEWSNGLKGAYNAADLNRLTLAANYLLTWLKESGYKVPEGTAPVSMVSVKVLPFGSGKANGALAYTGDTVTLQAREIGDSRFLRWEENGETIGTNRTLTVTADRDRELTAVFLAEWTAQTSILGMAVMGKAILGRGLT